MTALIRFEKQEVSKFFEEQGPHVYGPAELTRVIRAHRNDWKFSGRLKTEEIVEHLLSHTKLRRVVLTSTTYPGLTRFSWGDPSPYSVALSLRPEAYLSHLTAAFLNGLTDQIPRVIYVNREQSSKPRSGTLAQEGIDRAFARPQRESNYVLQFDSWQVILVSGKNTERLEVSELKGPDGEALDCTGPERTLIDMAVRPSYGGGVHEVQKSFRTARGRISINTLVATLRRLDYIYPYHQAIGFYLEQAGFEKPSLEPLRAMGINYDFYLAHGMKKPAYSQPWRLFHPDGM
jgi:hypothetical protein